jgi:hypothetical protein
MIRDLAVPRRQAVGARNPARSSRGREHREVRAAAALAGQPRVEHSARPTNRPRPCSPGSPPMRSAGCRRWARLATATMLSTVAHAVRLAFPHRRFAGDHRPPRRRSRSPRRPSDTRTPASTTSPTCLRRAPTCSTPRRWGRRRSSPDCCRPTIDRCAATGSSRATPRRRSTSSSTAPSPGPTPRWAEPERSTSAELAPRWPPPRRR